VVYEKAFNKFGQFVWGFVYSPTAPGEPARGHFVGPDGYPQPQRQSTAEYVEIEYTPEGFERIRRYFDRKGKRQPGPDNAFGVLQECDERGLATKQVSLNAEDKPMMDTYGNAGALIRYDRFGNPVEVTYFDEAGQPVQIKYGYAKITVGYDRRGNLTEVAYFDEAGRPTVDKDGHARWTAQYDERGNRTEEAYFGLDGKPALHPDGYARWTAQYDDRGNRTEEAYFGLDGKPTRHKDGYARWTAQYDERGNRTEVAYFDEAGRPVRHSVQGFAKARFAYDDKDNMIDAAYFDVENSRLRTRVVIKSVESGSQGEQLGLKVGDILLTYAGREIANTPSFISGRRDERQGENPRELVILREGERLTFSIKPGLIGAVLEDRALPEARESQQEPVKKP
jgi:YD repeat-containing protein